MADVKLTLATEVEIDAAHYLENYEGKCANIHGHRWKVRVEVSEVTPEDDLFANNGMLIDFGSIKKILNNYDHALIQAQDRVSTTAPQMHSVIVGYNPTAENLALAWADEIDSYLKQFGSKARVSKITVWETPSNSVTWEF